MSVLDTVLGLAKRAKDYYEQAKKAREATQPNMIAKGAASIGRLLQKTPDTTIRIKQPEPQWTGNAAKDVFTGREKAGRKILEFVSSLPGEIAKSYGRTIERVATPTGRSQLWQSTKRIASDPLRLENLSEPAVETAFDIPDFLPGGFLVGGLRRVGREAIEKTAKEVGEKAVREAGEKVAREGSERIVKKAAPKVLAEEAIAKGKYAFNVNKQHLSLSKKERQVLDQVVEKVKPELESVRGKALSNDEVLKAAKESEVLRKAVGRDDTLRASAAVLKSRQKLATLDRELGSLAKKGDSTAMRATMKEFLTTLEDVSSVASDWGRKLQSMRIEADDSVRREVLERIMRAGADTDKVLDEAVKVNWGDGRSIADFYRKFVKPSASEILDEMRYNNMLSSPQTHIVNTFSNILQTTALRPATLGVKGGIDWVVSGMTGRERKAFAKEMPEYYKGVVANLGDAWQQFLDALSGKAVIQRPDVGQMATGKIPKVWTYPSRILEASDRFFSTLGMGGELKALETTGVADDALETLAKKRAEATIFRAPLDITGEKTGQGYLLRQVDKLTGAVYDAGKKFKPLRWFVPFVQTPMNILKQGIEYSPAGIAAIPGAVDKTEQLAKTLIGSSVFSMGGLMALSGRTTWAAPTGKKEKEHFYATGRKPFAVMVGDKWVSYSKLGPLAYPLAMAAAVKHYFGGDARPDDDTLKNIGQVIAGVGQFFSDQSYVQGIGNLVRAAQGDEYAQKQLLADTGRQMIPLTALQGWVARIIDPVYRKPGSQIESVLAGIPFASKTMEPYTTPKGETSRRPYPLINALLPVQISTEQPEYERGYQQYLAEKAQSRIKSIGTEIGKKKKELYAVNYDPNLSFDGKQANKQKVQREIDELTSTYQKTMGAGEPPIKGVEAQEEAQSGSPLMDAILKSKKKDEKQTLLEDILKDPVMTDEEKAQRIAQIPDIEGLLLEKAKSLKVVERADLLQQQWTSMTLEQVAEWREEGIASDSVLKELEARGHIQDWRAWKKKLDSMTTLGKKEAARTSAKKASTAKKKRTKKAIEAYYKAMETPKLDTLIKGVKFPEVKRDRITAPTIRDSGYARSMESLVFGR